MNQPSDQPSDQPAPKPSERVTPLKATLGDRIGAGVIALLTLTVLSIGAWLVPAADGHGTHTQLGLAPCIWAATLDKPCPTCGMTTSFSYAGEGAWIQSAKTQPMGMLLVLMTATVFWGAAVQAVTGARISTIIQPALRPRVFIILGLLLLAAWVYKISIW